MLVIRRRPGQSILIGDHIEVEILDAGFNKVKLGILGPRSVRVTRKELKLTAQSNRAAALLSVEMKELIVNKITQIPQAAAKTSDKNSES